MLKKHHWRFINARGFTLVELMVSLAVIGFLMAITLSGYQATNQRYVLNQAAQKLVADLRRAQNMTMSGTGLKENHYFGYGILAKPGDNFYQLYADESGNSLFDAAGPAEDIVETISLPNKIKIQSTSPLSSLADIFFKAPNPTTFVNGATSSPATIILGTEDGSLAKTITVTLGGVIISN